MNFPFRKSSSRSTPNSRNELFIEELESRVMLSTVQIFAAGDTGDESFRLITDGMFADSFRNVGGNAANGEFLEFVYETEDELSASDIKIRFANDLYDPANGVDRNLTVDRIVVDGETFYTESEEVFSIGVFQGDDMAAGFGRGSTLFTNGYFKYGQNPDAASALTVYALGLQGDEQFQVEVGGLVVGSFSTAGETGMNPYEISLNRSISPNDVRVSFTNDLYQPEIGIDRNLIVDRIEINGTALQTESPSVFSTGTYIAGQGIVSGNLQTETLHANGYFQFSNSGLDSTPPIVTVSQVNDLVLEGERSVDIEISISDDVAAVFPPGNLDTAISVIGPNGEIFETFEIFGFNGPNGTKNVAYAFRNPTGAAFRATDNGTYQIFLNENTVPDEAGNFASAGVIGSFEINITDSPQTDVTPPQAFVVSNREVTYVANTPLFVVDFEDDVKMGTIANDAITVTGPNGYEAIATPITGGGFGDTIRSRGYTLTPNGGSWGPEDDGTFTVILNANSVFDDALNAAEGGLSIGSFSLTVPPQVG